MTFLGVSLTVLLGLVGVVLPLHLRRRRKKAEIAREWENTQRAAIIRRLSAHFGDTPRGREDSDASSREHLIDEMNRVIDRYFELAREHDR